MLKQIGKSKYLLDTRDLQICKTIPVLSFLFVVENMLILSCHKDRHFMLPCDKFAIVI